MPVKDYMSWFGGVDLVAMTEGAEAPNIVVHVAESVNTPVGTAPAGMILVQRDPNAAPEAMAFISTDTKVAEYFAPTIFKGTPFAGAPAMVAEMTFTSTDASVGAKVVLGEMEIEASIGGLGALEHHSRNAREETPFLQEVIERIGSDVSLKINGQDVPISLPPVGISGGAPAVSSPAGMYSRS